MDSLTNAANAYLKHNEVCNRAEATWRDALNKRNELKLVLTAAFDAANIPDRSIIIDAHSGELMHIRARPNRAIDVNKTVLW